jgi:subtilase family serine protease
MRTPHRSLFLFLMAGIAQAAAAAPATYVIAHNTPPFVAMAQSRAPVNTSEIIDVTLWLTPRNRAGLDTLIGKMYDHTSPLYHHWLSRDALGRMLAPTPNDMAAVSTFLQRDGLSIVARDKFNFFVRVRGSIAAMQKAFNVTLANVTYAGKTYRSNLADPAIADPAGAHVMTVEGLDNVAYRHHDIAQSDAIKGLTQGAAKTTPAATATLSAKACITGTGTRSFTSSGTLPYATFTGNLYTTSTIGCGYTPAQIQAAYGLTSLYTAGYDGTGQTIVILDWCGSPSITGDANAFSEKYGLPPLNSANFSIVNYPGISSCSAPDPEINIDVEWAHAIAPGANILLLVPSSADFQDVDSALVYEVENDIGNTSSNSFGSEEYYTPPAVLTLQNFIMETAASVGLAVNVSTGDDGDFTFDFPAFNPPSVSSPADSPYVTGVGGISLGLTPTSGIKFQAAWGTNETELDYDGYITVPAYNLGFLFGSGGGPSAIFPKPGFQSALKGTHRQLPDISWLGDPFTGGIIAISEPFTSPGITYQVYGGTSLACPMFAALWAIADQVAGTSLGNAAPLLYAAPSSVVTDIVPYASGTNVKAVFQTVSGNVAEGPVALASPLEGNKSFVSALWLYPDNPDIAYLITFGTDSGLKPAPGWDNATGLGVPNPAALITHIMTEAASFKQ